MNIAFITQRRVNPQDGGLERITSVLANTFRELKGYNCINLYLKESSTSCNEGATMPNTYIPYDRNFREALAETLVKCDIDIIINQDVQFAVREIANAIKNNGLKTRTIFCHHVSPGAEISHLNFKYYLTFFKRQHNFTKNLVRLFALTLEKILLPRFLKHKYQELYRNNDRIIVLSKEYIAPWCSIGGVKSSEKIRVVNNCLTYRLPINISEVTKKEKKILIVSRLTENHKNISDAVRIWNRIEHNDEFKDWNLIILGEGPDKNYYSSLINRLGLERIYLEGKKDPLEYYRKCSIYMMTSHLEGWPMTLGEAMQNGTVPIAYNSFGAAKEIIEDKYNGILVTPFDENQYYEKLINLMRNEELRHQYALNSIESTESFKADNITLQWASIIEELLQKPR